MVWTTRCKRVISSVGREEFQVIGSILPSPGMCLAGLRSGVTVISLKWLGLCECECERDWVWDSCRLSRSYQSPFNVRALWRQPRANYSTGHRTDESWRRERWLSVCVQRSVCVCSCESVCVCVWKRERKRDVRAECHPDICQGPVCIYLYVCVSESVHKVSETTPRVTLQLCHVMNTQQKVSSSL